MCCCFRYCLVGRFGVVVLHKPVECPKGDAVAVRLLFSDFPEDAFERPLVGPAGATGERLLMLDYCPDRLWPTLRANLIALAAETREHPLLHLHEAALGRNLSTAEDMAAVLNWRLPEPTSTHSRPPLPWLPGIPQAINNHPDWRQYLARRSQLIADLADHIRHHAHDDGTQPHWVPQNSSLSAALIGEVAVWRAANGVDPHDRRPTGPKQLPTAPAEWQQHFDRSITPASDYPANFDFRRRGVGSTTEGGRHEDRHHRQRPSKINQWSRPPGPSF